MNVGVEGRSEDSASTPAREQTGIGKVRSTAWEWDNPAELVGMGTWVEAHKMVHLVLDVATVPLRDVQKVCGRS